MEIKDILASTRSPYVLIDRPSIKGKYWASSLPGLHSEHIKEAVNQLRNAHKREFDEQQLKNIKELNVSALQTAFAQRLGAKNYPDWLRIINDELTAFLRMHGLTTPTDLFRPTTRSKRNNIHVSASDIADRLFDLHKPQPKKIYTGLKGRLFQYAPVHYTVIDQIGSGFLREGGITEHLNDDDYIEILKNHRHKKISHIRCREDEFEVVLDDGVRIPISKGDLRDMTCQEAMLSGGTFYFSALDLLNNVYVFSYLLCDSDETYPEQNPTLRNPTFVPLLKAALNDDVAGWLEVLPFNQNIIFLKSSDGQFDWIVRDEKNGKPSENPFYPILNADELPSASKDAFNIWYSYQQGRSRIEDLKSAYDWLELKKQDGQNTQKSQYELSRLLEAYLTSNGEYIPSHQKIIDNEEKFHSAPVFLKTEVEHHPLYVSELITVEHFKKFDAATGWLKKRAMRVQKYKKTLECVESQLLDDDLPISVTFYDALAFCGWLEREMKLPVRLLRPEEWEGICPVHITAKNSQFKESKKTYADFWKAEHPEGDVSEIGVAGYDYQGKLLTHGILPRLDSASYERIPVRFIRERMQWATNTDNVRFLDNFGFAEWLDNARYFSGEASAVCAATGMSMRWSRPGTPDYDMASTGKPHAWKIGFRVCFSPMLKAEGI